MHLKVIDQETRDELADIGMEVEEPVRACSDCRFLFRAGSYEARCGARNLYFRDFHMNMLGDCQLWRARPPEIRAKSKIPAALGIAVAMIAVVATVIALM